jgi:hypothetical protein
MPVEVPHKPISSQREVLWRTAEATNYRQREPQFPDSVENDGGGGAWRKWQSFPMGTLRIEALTSSSSGPSRMVLLIDEN